MCLFCSLEQLEPRRRVSLYTTLCVAEMTVKFTLTLTVAIRT